MIKLVCWVLLLFSVQRSFAQQYLVYFANKNGTSFSLQNPAAFLSQKALERRLRYGISIDSTDLPVPPAFLSALSAVPGIRVINASRWLNAASIQVGDAAALAQVTRFSFVQSAKKIGTIKASKRAPKSLSGKWGRRLRSPSGQWGTAQNYYNYGRATGQVNVHKGSFLHNIGLRGDSMVIGMLDAGFFRYNTLPAFDSLIQENHVLGTWDFVSGDASVAEDNSHGMQCLSIIAANIPGVFVGSAPKASFFLFRSEDDRSEKLVEEVAWVCAAERLDSAGGDIISASLGYSVFDGGIGDHAYADLNGDVTPAAQGADMAARKGILVVASAGNSGNESWKYINTPADGDSVLAVGAVDLTGMPASFSGYGPTADGRIKPDMASVGVATVLQGANGAIGSGNGTSFSAPNIAGLAACLWQGFREANNMQILAALQQSGTTASAPDNRVGYGLPDMQKAAGILLKAYTKASVSLSGCRAIISWRTKDAAGMRHIIERKEAGNAFKEIGQLAATAGDWGNRAYNFTDRLDDISGLVQYRIKTVLDTAAASFYAVYTDTLRGDAACSASALFSIQPNPVQNSAVVVAAFPEAIPVLELALINSLGQKIGLQKWAKPQGTAQFALPVQGLPAGKYYLRLSAGGAPVATLDFLKL